MQTNEYKQIGARIQEVLHDGGLTQQNLADELHISKQVMSKIIKGGKAINAIELAKIAAVLGVKINDLISVQAQDEEEISISYKGNRYNVETQNAVDYVRDVICAMELLDEDLSNG